MKHWNHQSYFDSIVDLQAGFCVCQTTGDLYCVINYPHKAFTDNNIDEDIIDPAIADEPDNHNNNETFTTVIQRLNNKTNDKYYWWGEIGRENHSCFEIRYITNSLYCVNDKLFILFAVQKTSMSQVIRMYDIKKRKFETFCHYHNNPIKRINGIKQTIIHNRWILIAFKQEYRKYTTNNVMQLIDLQEMNILHRNQKLSLILPDTFTLLYIYPTIKSNNQTCLDLQIIQQFIRRIEAKLLLSTYKIQYMPMVLIHLIHHYYFGSEFQILFCGVSTTNSNMKFWTSSKFKRDILVFDYDHLW